MIRNKENKNFTILQILGCITYTVLLIAVVWNYQTIIANIQHILQLVKPFLYGFVIAYLIYLPMQKIDQVLPKSINRGRRFLSATFAIIAIILLLSFLIYIVVPQVIDSAKLFAQTLPQNMELLQTHLNSFLNQYEITDVWLEKFQLYEAQLQQSILTILSTFIPSIFNLGKSITATVANVVMGIVIAIYLIASKQKLCMQCDQIGMAFLPKKLHLYLKHILQLAHQVFSSFISGQLLEAIIIGVLCAIGATFLKIPYVPIVSVIIGLTNIIPIFGPIIGTAICGFLIFFISPVKAILFIIFGICLQQFESNLIYPKVVGSSVGLSGLWTLFAITIGGGLFGLNGMILGLPMFAILYTLLKEEVIRRNKKKEHIVL